jgi:hypothetical protein
MIFLEGETNLDLETPLWPVGSLHRSAMQAHRSLGDRQTEPDPAGLAATCIVNAIERTEQFVERLLWHTGARINNPDDGFRANASLFTLQ